VSPTRAREETPSLYRPVLNPDVDGFVQAITTNPRRRLNSARVQRRPAPPTITVRSSGVRRRSFDVFLAMAAAITKESPVIRKNGFEVPPETMKAGPPGFREVAPVSGLRFFWLLQASPAVNAMSAKRDRRSDPEPPPPKKIRETSANPHQFGAPGQARASIFPRARTSWRRMQCPYRRNLPVHIGRARCGLLTSLASTREPRQTRADKITARRNERKGSFPRPDGRGRRSGSPRLRRRVVPRRKQRSPP